MKKNSENMEGLDQKIISLIVQENYAKDLDSELASITKIEETFAGSASEKLP